MEAQSPMKKQSLWDEILQQVDQDHRVISSEIQNQTGLSPEAASLRAWRNLLKQELMHAKRAFLGGIL